MKKVLSAIIVLLTLTLICGCNEKEQKDMETTGSGKILSDKTVTFINSIEDADAWILSDTKENRGTSLWGSATAGKVKAGERRDVPLCEQGDDGRYIFRMIDVDEIYYSANGIELKDGWTIEIKGEDFYSIKLEVTDENGVLMNTYEVFAAAL